MSTRKPKLDPGLLAAHKAYEAAINTNQTDLVMAMYDEGAAQMPPDAPQTVGWKQLREAVDSYFKAYKTHWKKVVQMNWVDGEWGYDQGHDTAVDIPRDGGPAIHYDCKGILIYRRQANGEWKVFRDIWNNNTPPKTVPQKGVKTSPTKAAPSSTPAKTAPKARAAKAKSPPAAKTKSPPAKSKK
ncbi:MAG: hypothetical protein J0L92_18745 [Deltaproteobacteria bacterium]|nr:hypothetical protein [Deltaproteobacteria bacterium]